MGIKEVLSAPRSPWQRAYVERVIGKPPRALDHVIASASLTYRHVKSFHHVHHESRTYLALAKTHQNRGPCSRGKSEPSLRYRKLVVFTTGTRERSLNV